MNAAEAREKAQRLLELAEKATPGKWVWRHNNQELTVDWARDTGDFVLWVTPGGEPTNDDAKFIATARNDAPALAKWVLEAVAVLQDTERRLDELYDHAYYYTGDYETKLACSETLKSIRKLLVGGDD